MNFGELNNREVYLNFAELICHFNFSAEASSRVEKIIPKNSNNIQFSQVINEWGPSLADKIPRFLATLQTMHESTGNRRLLEKIDIVKTVQEVFLFEGYEEHFGQLATNLTNGSPAFPIVLCHNDTQQNNILMSLTDSNHLLLIDYEYAGWNPMVSDLANYVTETMRTQKEGRAFAWSLEKCMQHEQICEMASRYLEVYFETYAVDDIKQLYDFQAQVFVSKEIEAFVRHVYDCCMLHQFYCGVWALAVLDPSPSSCCHESNDRLFDYAIARVEAYHELQNHVKTL